MPFTDSIEFADVVGEAGRLGVPFVVGVTEDHVKAHSAVDLVRVGSAALGGKGGGGRPDMAQAGGPDGDRAADALAAIESGNLKNVRLHFEDAAALIEWLPDAR